MMNDFGVPMTDADINMTSNPAKAMLNQQMATTGMENQFWGAVVGGVISGGAALIGGSRAANAAADQAELQNQAAARRYEYDLKAWDMKKDQLINDRLFVMRDTAMKAKNENRRADYVDAMNANKYQYDLKIRNRQQQSNEDQFKRSEEIYASQTDLNAISAQTAYDDERRQLEEIHTEMAFDRQDAYLESLINEGKLRARGVTGRSAMKGYQATAADFGRQMSQLNEAFSGAGRNSRAAMAAIASDKMSADLAAYAQRMLDPGDLPMPLQPLPTFRTEFIMPRALGAFDFGPEPVMGATASPGAAASRVWGSTIASVGSSIGGIASGTSGQISGWTDW